MSRSSLGCSRREALRIGGFTGIVAVAGCLTPASRADSCSDGTDLSLVEAADAHVSNEFSTPVDGLPHATATVVEEALGTGEATARGYYAPQLQTEYVVTGPEARYYRVTTNERDRTETTGYEYAVEIGIDDATLSDDDPVRPFTDLPAHDRTSIRSAIGHTGLLHAPHYTSFSAVFAYEHDEVRERSRFVPETDVQYVEWEDTVLRLEFEERRPVHITSTTVVAERVATSLEAFVVHIGAERGVVLDGLTSRQREIVTRAIEDGYTECRPYSESFIDLLDRLSMSERSFVSLVQYDSVWYFTHISYRSTEHSN